MHKFILNIFDFIKNALHFFKIVLLFLMIGVVLLWIQSLTKTTWSNFSWFNAISSELVGFGSIFSKESINIWGAIFELKYVFTLFLLIFLYYLDNVFIKVNTHTEELYKDCKKAVNKKQEEIFNKNLVKMNTIQQKKINNYIVFISATVKQQYDYKNIDIEKEFIEINKFLIKQTGSQPSKYLNGYLYNYNNFENIDNVLTEFSKLISPKASLDFTVCVQIVDSSINDAIAQLNTLIGLNFTNKISTFSDTVWRYNFNSNKSFLTSQLGIFQKENQTYEASEFVKK